MPLVRVNSRFPAGVTAGPASWDALVVVSVRVVQLTRAQAWRWPAESPLARRF